MSWARTAGTAAKYRTPEHRAWRKHYTQMMRAQGYLVCAQPVCVMGSRTIEQGMAWHVGHDESGEVYIGPVHRACNLKDAAVRARARQLKSERRWIL